jgi:dihydrofolate synthase/folylpolyglutamate synthase
LLSLDGKQILKISRNGENAFEDLKIDLLGNYQQKNVPTVLKTIEILQQNGWKLSNENIYDGLNDAAKTTGLMGRWQIIGNNPLIVCDTGHNEDGIKMVVNQINNTAYQNLHIVFGMVADKDIEHVLQLLPREATYYFTRAVLPRALDEKILAGRANSIGLKGRSYPSVTEAFTAAVKNAGKNDLVFVGGSNFVVAEILQQKK